MPDSKTVAPEKDQETGRRWKREDIKSRVVLGVYALPHEDMFPADQKLMDLTGAPAKVVWAAMVREEDSGNLDCGASLRGGWLTEKGRAQLCALTGNV